MTKYNVSIANFHSSRGRWTHLEKDMWSKTSALNLAREISEVKNITVSVIDSKGFGVVETFFPK